MKAHVHWYAATDHCKGGRNDDASWLRVTCPKCLKSKPDTSEVERMLARMQAELNATGLKYLLLVDEWDGMSFLYSDADDAVYLARQFVWTQRTP